MGTAAVSEIGISEFLADEGFTAPDAAAAARAALESAGLTRPGKGRMVAQKLDSARNAIGLSIARSCGSPECEAVLAADGRHVVRVARFACTACAGSNNLRALRRMAVACARAGVWRVLVVGGRPPAYVAMKATLAKDLELRFVDGTSNLPNGTDALRDCAWADLLIIWAPTPLPHKVSSLYRAEVCAVPDRVAVHRRGIEALAAEVIEHLS